MATWSISGICLGAIILASAASVDNISSFTRYMLCGIGGVLFLIGLSTLARLDQDIGSHKFGYTGGFTCPFVPFLPVACIIVNTYLLINLGTSTWIRVSVWLAIGILVYLFYGRKHSSLLDAIYVPTALATEIYLASSDWSLYTTPVRCICSFLAERYCSFRRSPNLDICLYVNLHDIDETFEFAMKMTSTSSDG